MHPSDFPEKASYDIGSSVTFEGIVRRDEGGKELSFLLYEAERDLAERELMNILEEAKQKYHFEDAIAVHRIGKLAPGERSLFVRVFSEHRKEGFEGCIYIVDELKRRLPIWKKDIYNDGSEKWH
ncbi:MAG: molybdenum cofactor biosynthesis protein MoaE [Thermoplasmatales archaeon]